MNGRPLTDAELIEYLHERVTRYGAALLKINALEVYDLSAVHAACEMKRIAEIALNDKWPLTNESK